MPKVLVQPSQPGPAPAKVLSGLLVAVGLILAAWTVRIWGIPSNHAPAHVQNLPDPESFFAKRSPGPRGSGALLQTKHAIFRLASTALKPYERVLANLRYPLPPVAFLPPSLLPPGLLPANLMPDPGGGPPDGGGSIPSIPGLPGTVTPGRPSIPEPSTWSMLIIGIFMIGSSLRRQQRLAKSERCCDKPQARKRLARDWHGRSRSMVHESA